ncbi:MAG: hypothetical protein NT176_12455 [Proteobacteria bacterium]|nr:hypothetical protein [Pseudomonadota bacterium]
MPLIRTALAAAFTLVSLSAVAQYPDKQVKIIVPYPPAGTTDILARLTATTLTDPVPAPAARSGPSWWPSLPQTVTRC